MRWTSQQLGGLDAVGEWFNAADRKPWFFLAGFAGTGKTTLVKRIAQQLGGTTLYGAYTGKAAAVMRAKGCDNATTIDSMIYRPLLQASCIAETPCETLCPGRCRYRRERFVGREINPESDVAGADLVIIDEVSMVGEDMARDLMSYEVPILVLGDPAQLPPMGDAGYFTDREPDFVLTEVHRQAFGSPIIDLATQVRNRQRLRRGDYGDSAVVDDLSVDDMLEYEQIIVGTHRTRCWINREVRKARGFRGEVPEPGEKVICLKNNRRKGLRNGTIWTVNAVKSKARGFVDMQIEDEDEGCVVEVNAPIEGFELRDGSGSDLPGDPFTFGYAITCHKAQGSQWHSVVVIDESSVFREHSFEWLYTAITRAVERVTVVS
jgi:exodeoxyribonuclease-5